MNIHQISANHDEQQDRLLLRLNTQNAQEFRFWLTRRLTLRLLPFMDESVTRLEAAQPGMIATDQPAQQILTDLKREAFFQTADFATPYVSPIQEQDLSQVGEPLLITDVHITLQANGSLQLVLEQKVEPDPRSHQLNLPAHLVHGLIHLIRQSMVKAEWISSIDRVENGAEKTLDITLAPTTAYQH